MVSKTINDQLTLVNQDSPDLLNDIANIIDHYIPYNVCKIYNYIISIDDAIFKKHEEACLAKHLRIIEMMNIKFARTDLCNISKRYNPFTNHKFNKNCKDPNDSNNEK